MSIGKALRMRRLSRRGRSVIVALDHGIGAGVVRGLESPLEIVKMAAGCGADGVLITPGILEQVYEEIGDLAVLLRIDGCVTSLGSGPMKAFGCMEDAVALGADAVVLNATIGAPYEGEELEKVGCAATEGRRLGMPVIAEILSWRMMANHMDMSGAGKEVLPEDIGRDVALACRVGVELGADAVKTRYSGDIESFRRVVAACGKPIFVAGGPRRDDGLDSTLRLVNDVLDAGAVGVIFGRNIWQHPDPAAALRAVCAMVHEDATMEEALDAAAV